MLVVRSAVADEPRRHSLAVRGDAPKRSYRVQCANRLSTHRSPVELRANFFLLRVEVLGQVPAAVGAPWRSINSRVRSATERLLWKKARVYQAPIVATRTFFPENRDFVNATAK